MRWEHECSPRLLDRGTRGGVTKPAWVQLQSGRVYSSNSQLNLSYVFHENTPATLPDSPEHPLKTPKQPLNAPRIPQEALTLVNFSAQCKHILWDTVGA